MTTQIDDIFYGSSGKLGKLRFAVTGLGWKSGEEGGEVVTLPANDMKWCTWTRVARDFQLCFGRKGSEERMAFEGFQRDDQEKISNFIKQNYPCSVEIKETSLKGLNWGKVDIQGPNLAFLINQKPSFTLPLSQIANSNITNKTEVSLEIVPPVVPPAPTGGGKTRVKPTDDLVELRFHIPGTVGKGGSDDGSDDEEGAKEGGEEGASAAQAFHDMIKDRAEIGEGGGDSVVVFNEVLVLTPRGRYDIDMFLTHFRLRGKTYDYKILHTSVTRLFLLPKADEIHIQLVIGLDPPIRQGQTRYPYLVMQFTKDEEMDAEMNLEDDDLEKHSLQKKYEAPAFQVVSQIFKSLTQRRITAPSSFTSTTGQNVVKCNLKAVQGELYFLEKGMIFIAKQPVLVEFSNVLSLSFSRVGGNMASSKTFDMSISLKSRTDSASDYSFTGLAKDDAGPIKAYLQERKVRVKDTTEEEAVLLADDLSDEDEDDSGDDSDGGGKLANRKKNGKDAAGAKAPAGGAMDEDDDESEDEDFQASESDGGSATSSSDDEDSDGDVEMAAPAKKSKGGDDEGPKKKKAKRDD